RGTGVHSAIEKACPFAKQPGQRLISPDPTQKRPQVALTPDSEQNRADQLAARREREQEVFLREVDDAVRQAQLGAAIKRSGWPVAGALALGLAGFGGWLYWKDYREEQIEGRSEKLI